MSPTLKQQLEVRFRWGHALGIDSNCSSGLGSWFWVGRWFFFVAGFYFMSPRVFQFTIGRKSSQLSMLKKCFGPMGGSLVTMERIIRRSPGWLEPGNQRRCRRCQFWPWTFSPPWLLRRFQGSTGGGVLKCDRGDRDCIDTVHFLCGKVEREPLSYIWCIMILYDRYTYLHILILLCILPQFLRASSPDNPR